MAGRVEGKVALVTGAGRGQGRSHALRLAEEGADVIALDICQPVETFTYPMSSEEDLADTAHQVEALDRRVVTAVVDVRDHERLDRDDRHRPERVWHTNSALTTSASTRSARPRPTRR